eukprot:gb/GECH01007217.1/.p1 GENE.gb/GECH01007217.1/~~gb/GECH01007217.1/.p1  ORF type:complete len:109 (+),score=22.84 gb/GECH01007217.1/:1-327(+)
MSTTQIRRSIRNAVVSLLQSHQAYKITPLIERESSYQKLSEKKNRLKRQINDQKHRLQSEGKRNFDIIPLHRSQTQGVVISQGQPESRSLNLFSFIVRFIFHSIFRWI